MIVYSSVRLGRLPRYCTGRATHSWGQAPELSLWGQVCRIEVTIACNVDRKASLDIRRAVPLSVFLKLEINAYLFCKLKILHYLCRRLLLVIGAFGRQSSVKYVAIISCSVSSLLVDGVTLRSGFRLWKYVANDN